MPSLRCEPGLLRLIGAGLALVEAVEGIRAIRLRLLLSRGAELRSLQVTNLSAKFLNDEPAVIGAEARGGAFAATGLLPQVEILASKRRDLGCERREWLTQLRERGFEFERESAQDRDNLRTGGEVAGKSHVWTAPAKDYHCPRRISGDSRRWKQHA